MTAPVRRWRQARCCRWAPSWSGLERDHPGQVLDVELDLEKHGDVERWVYEVKLLRKGGALVKLEVDARTGTVISRKVKD